MAWYPVVPKLPPGISAGWGRDLEPSILRHFPPERGEKPGGGAVDLAANPGTNSGLEAPSTNQHPNHMRTKPARVTARVGVEGDISGRAEGQR